MALVDRAAALAVVDAVGLAAFDAVDLDTPAAGGAADLILSPVGFCVIVTESPVDWMVGTGGTPVLTTGLAGFCAGFVDAEA